MSRSYRKTLSFKPTGTEQEAFLPKGSYLFEAWGSAGYSGVCANISYSGGRGAYVSGYISLKEPKKIYVYVGTNEIVNGETFNGNKIIGHSRPGGGATDFRLKKGDKWYDLDSLKSRIMVAAAGGGSDCHIGGDGGTFEGKLGKTVSAIRPTQGNQTHPGKGGKFDERGYAYDGEFGVGGSGACVNNTNCDGAGGGGSGYYGSGGMTGVGGSPGGSSFISGFDGCIAIDAEGNPTNSSIHMSGLFFKFGKMLAGDEEMPSFNKGNMTMIGNTSPGFARITYLFNSHISCNAKIFHSSLFMYALIILVS